MPLKESQTIRLIDDFKTYSDKMHSIQIYSDDFRNTIIKFYPCDEGIKWLICHNVYRLGEIVDILNVTINPKILGGTIDYITAADSGDLNIALTNFDRIFKSISRILGNYESYQVKRIDYCVNFSLNELVPGCSSNQIMKLIKQSKIPYPYEEWKIYNEQTHRKEGRASSYYLKSDSVNINCYSKYMKFQEQSQGNIERGRPPITQEWMDKAEDIIRFEVQCKSSKIYSLSKKMKIEKGYQFSRFIHPLFHPDFCSKIIDDYYHKTIGSGDWYTLTAAIRKIQSMDYEKPRVNRLIDALRKVNRCRSIPKAMEMVSSQGGDLAAFMRTLKELETHGINPVTIPRDWGIEHIPNLLWAYNHKKYDTLMGK